MWDQNIKEAEKSVDKAKRDVDKAEEQFQKAAERLKEEEAKVSAAAPAQAGGLVRFCMCSCCCCLWLAAFPHGRRVSRAGHRFCFLGSCSPLSKDSARRKLHCVGLQHSGEQPVLCSLCALQVAVVFV